MRSRQTFPLGTLLSLVLVAVSTLVLMALSTEAVRTQRNAIRSLRESNRQLAGERLVEEIESSVMEMLEACLANTDTSHLDNIPLECRAVGSLFIVEDGRLLNPGARDPLAERTAKDLQYVFLPPTLKIYPLGYAGEAPAQLFYTSLPLPGKRRILVAVVDLDAFRADYFPGPRARTGVAAELVPVAQGTPPGVQFRNMFPFWQIRVAASPENQPARHDLVIFTATLFSMGFGIFLLVRANVRIWRLDRQRAAFISGFSHELRPPVGNVRLHADLIHDGGALSSSDQRFCEVIIAEAERLRLRIDKVLSAEAINRGRRKYDMREADLCEVANRTVDSFRAWVEQQGFTLDMRAESPSLAVRLDADAAADAMLNLMENAVKYSGRSRRIEVSMYQRDRFAIFAVRDWGIGIPQSEQKKIFGEFYRPPGHSATTGFGLGLFLVRDVMRAHGGSVDVESSPGTGSRFRLKFPLCAKS
jgi:signal transduction histidine kinase